jgi:biopolymer transport protein ExbD
MAMAAGSQEQEVTDINVTPLVDVCLVLVIIFMVTAPIMVQPVLKVNLPNATTKEGEEKENISITLGKDGEWALNEATLENKEQAAELLLEKMKKSKDKYVIIRADRMVAMGVVLEAMGMAKKAGAKNISIATEQKKR